MGREVEGGREGDGKGEREMGETYSLNQSSSTCT